MVAEWSKRALAIGMAALILASPVSFLLPQVFFTAVAAWLSRLSQWRWDACFSPSDRDSI